MVSFESIVDQQRRKTSWESPEKKKEISFEEEVVRISSLIKHAQEKLEDKDEKVMENKEDEVVCCCHGMKKKKEESRKKKGGGNGPCVINKLKRMSLTKEAEQNPSWYQSSKVLGDLELETKICTRNTKEDKKYA
ncbi:unnamed protein product [Arabidopsis halleri]